jgi:hypothetical protein
VNSRRGFTDVAQNTINVVEEDELALRLNGTDLTVTLEEAIEKLQDNFKAEVKFYYDGSTRGRILAIGDYDDGGWSPGWSIGVQPGILTLHVRQKGTEQTERCILNTPDDGTGEWFTVEMNVDIKEQKMITSSLTTGNISKVECHRLELLSPFEYNKENEEVEKLRIGGSDGSNRKGENNTYKGAIVYVQLSTPAKPEDGEEVWMAKWEFGSDENKGESNISVSAQSDYKQTITLPPGEWAWVPVNLPVLMPLQITSDSTWKATSANIPAWLESGNIDDDWSYAWDMPRWEDWIEKKEARWIWAAGTDRVCHSCDCKLIQKCSWKPFGCNSKCSMDCNQVCYDIAPKDDAYLLRVIEDLDGNPVTATVQIAGDDTYTFYVNGVVKGTCSAGPCYTELQEFVLDNLHIGENIIAIQAHNNGGPAGVLVIIDIDFYEILEIPPIKDE